MDPAEDGFDTDLGFEDNQATAKKRSPLLKIILIGAGLVGIIFAIMTFGGGGATTNTTSTVSPAPVDSNSLPAQKDPTPEYREAMEQYNSEIVQKANETGTSAIPIPVDPSRKQIVTTIEENQEDPAERFRQIQEEYRRQQEHQDQEQKGAQDEETKVAYQKALQDTTQRMTSYLSSVLNKGKRGVTGDLEISFADPNAVNEGTQAGGGAGPAGAGGLPGADPALAGVVAKGKVLLPATTIEYGQLLLEANTDAPGPVLALMVTGKLAGSRLLGSFSQTDEYLTLNFSTLVTKDGRTIPINAIAIDPDTTLPGVITEIDRRYFSRIVVPAAADFISGVGSAIAETETSTTQTSSSTTTSSNDPDFSEAISQGIEDSFSGISDILQDQASKTQILLRVAAGTPIGILFTQEVTEPVETNGLAQPPVAQQPPSPFGTLGQIPFGFAPVGFGFPVPGTAPVPASGAPVTPPVAAPVGAP